MTAANPHVDAGSAGAPQTASEATVLFGPPRVIYIISPQPWNGFRVSKHHYAIELAALGHRVYFIDPPDAKLARGAVRRTPTDIAGLTNVRYAPWFPYKLKFHARPLFDAAMRRQAHLLAQAIGEKPHIVWDFDNAYQFANLKAFGAGLNVFHPVDDFEPRFIETKNADIIFSVAQRFLDRFTRPVVPMHLVPHGLSRDYAATAQRISASPDVRERDARRPCIGYVGNLEHSGVDWPTILAMCDLCPDADFVFIGPYKPAGGRTPIDAIAQRANCRLLGAKSAADIIALASGIDVWLICYDAVRTVDGATNSHKILEYLASGCAVLSNRIDAYAGTDLAIMPPARDNAPMPQMLRNILDDLPAVNAPDRQRRRAQFALQHSYGGHLHAIDQTLSALRGLRFA